MKRKIWFSMLVALVCLGLTACGSSAAKQENEAAGDEAAAEGDTNTAISEGTAADNGGEATKPEDTDEIQVEPEETDDYGIMNLPLGMYLSVKEVKDGVVTLEIDNQSGYEMSYGGDFFLDVEKDGQWERVSMQDGVAIADIAYVIEDLEKQEYTIDLNALYGELEAGHYRLYQDDMSAEFDLP